jgi:GntP family gluconate:H+ symporter
MSPLLILLVGMIVVVGGVLALRLHAFLALVLGALVVAGLTPRGFGSRYGAREAARTTGLTVVSQDPVSQTVRLSGAKSGILPGSTLVVLRPGPEGYRQIATLGVVSVDRGSAIAFVRDAGTTDTITSDDLVLEPYQEAAVRKSATQTIGERVAEGFSRTVLEIGILIAMAAIVGQTLLESGAAERIVLSARRVVGDERAGLAFLGSGYVLGIPVFFDTVFYLLIPLAKVMRLRSGRDYTLYVLCVVAGATMTHSLVPPTPGPLFVAAELRAGVGPMMLGGMVVSAFAAIAGYAYAKWANRRWDVPLRAEVAGGLDLGVLPADAEQAAAAVAGEKAAADATSARSVPRDLPPLWLSLTPILLPVILISLSATLGAPAADARRPAWKMAVLQAVHTLGEKNLSLTVAAAIGLLMVVARRRGASDKGRRLSASVGDALSSAGVIILITAAGGAFGYVLRQTDIAATLKDLLPATRLALLPLAFLFTTLIRVAQGSATVAMIAAAGIVSPIAAGGAAALGFHPVYLALAIGCGSKPVMWMNDSGFWIIGKMSGLTEAETLKTATVMMAIMGVVGLAVTMLGAWLVPLA